MSARSVWLVASRELRQSFRRKSFWVVAAILLLGSTAGMVVPELIDSGRTRYDVGLVGAGPELEQAVRAGVALLDADVDVVAPADLAAGRQAVDDGDLDVVAVAGPDPVVVARSDDADQLVAVVQQALAARDLQQRLEALGVDPAEAADALTVAPAPVERLDEEGSGRRATSSILSLAMYLLLLILMVQVANGVAIEKANRISEVLVAIVRPGALLFGKVVGVGLLGLFTVLCGAVPVLVKLAVSDALPEGLGAALAAGGAFFVLGATLYLTVAGALGALVERPEEAGSVVTPLTLVLVVVVLVAQQSTDSALAVVLAQVPFSSPMVMPARIAMGHASAGEVAASLGLLALAVAVSLRLGGVIYRRAVVRTGRRLKLREVLRPA